MRLPRQQESSFVSLTACGQSGILIYRNNYCAKVPIHVYNYWAKVSRCMQLLGESLRIYKIIARKLDLPLNSTAPSINSDIPATRRASAHRYEQLTAASFGRILERGRSTGACEDAV